MLRGHACQCVEKKSGAVVTLHTGVSSMLLYYRFFHPAGPIRLCSKQLQHSMECGTPPCLSDMNTEQMATVRSLKHCWQTDKDGTLTRYSSHVSALCFLLLMAHFKYIGSHQMSSQSVSVVKWMNLFTHFHLLPRKVV